MEETVSKAATLLGEIGEGANALLPELSKTVVGVYDNLVFNADGSVSTFAIVCVVGLVAMFGKWIIGKCRKHVI